MTEAGRSSRGPPRFFVAQAQTRPTRPRTSRPHRLPTITLTLFEGFCGRPIAHLADGR
jgi:hypothetical protein